MIPISIPNLSGNEEKYLQECIHSTYVSSVGPFVNKFRTMLCGKSDAEFAAPLNTGTAGLHLSLLVAGVNANELVILPSLTFIASANAISYCNAEPWLMDVDRLSWTLDPDELEKNLEAFTYTKNGMLYHSETDQRIAAIMPVYMLGTPADMDRILKIAEQYSLPVIADGAAALGAKYKGKAIGEIEVFATAISFNGNKTFTTGGGGAVISNDAGVIEKINHLATTARNGPGYDHDMVGYNYRLTNIQAAVGYAQLERFDEFIAAKSKIYNRYKLAFEKFEQIGAFPNPSWADSAHWLSGIYVDDKADKIEKIVTHLRSCDIDARTFWTPIHLQKPYLNAPRSSLKVSEEVYSKIIPLPCSTHLNEDEITHVIEAVSKALSN